MGQSYNISSFTNLNNEESLSDVSNIVVGKGSQVYMELYNAALLSMIKDGCFILKTGDGNRVVKREGIEPLCGKAYLYHRWQEVVKE